ncbi:hypothetical protein DACRYDRAFT_112446 [Dacryopinax primogenitus]|uniref:F-box domain-containing protein n=1 Tax=Dacryopinax primogenitus (strain DJM 731) TaxID=1858805 RepID=M5FN50_DACPD|nr:uncharacterized protein DACRYDRAFT_112446 [Dacryopinax primogenitus]EJT96830.1 hypothetical protein DACRYDRAFT_112446 [Dacryopinax primogenitus]
MHPTKRTLPLELLLEIIDSLILPTTSYSHPPIVQHTLLSLCLTSRLLSSLAFRHLYARVYLRTPSQLRAFLDLPRKRPTQALALAAGIPLSPSDVKRLWAAYPTLERLSLEGQIQAFNPSPSLSAPRPPTQVLEELALIPGGQRYPLEIFSSWTPCPHLKSLAFMHAVLHEHDDNLSAGYYSRLGELFPSLEVLVLTLPARSRRLLKSFKYMVECLPKLRKVLLVEPAPARRLSSSHSAHHSPSPSPSSSPSPTLRSTPLPSPTRRPIPLPASPLPSLPELTETIGKSLLARSPPVEVHELLATAHGCQSGDSGEGKKLFRDWFASVVREGSVWSLEGSVWGREEKGGEGDAPQVLLGEVVLLSC